MGRWAFWDSLARGGRWHWRQRPRKVRIVHWALPSGPGITDLATGEEIGRNVSIDHAAELWLARPGDVLHLRRFLVDSSGHYYIVPGSQYQIRGAVVSQTASETLNVKVVEVTRVTNTEEGEAFRRLRCAAQWLRYR
jgi:hypothetical protein